MKNPRQNRRGFNFIPVQDFRLCRNAHGKTKRYYLDRRLRRAAKPLCSYAFQILRLTSFAQNDEVGCCFCPHEQGRGGDVLTSKVEVGMSSRA